MGTVTLTINSQTKIVLPRDDYEHAIMARGWQLPKEGALTRAQKAALKQAYPQHVVITPYPSIGYQEFVALYTLGLLDNAYKSNRDGSGTVKPLLLLGQYAEGAHDRFGKLANIFAKAHGHVEGMAVTQPCASRSIEENIKGAPKSFHTNDIILRGYLSEVDRAYKAIAILPRPDGTAAKWVSLKSDKNDYRYVLWQPEEFTPVMNVARGKMNAAKPSATIT